MLATREARWLGWPCSQWVVPLFALGALLLVPWVVLLAVTLPSQHRAAHWDVAWVGFDVLLALLLLTVAISAWRRSPWLHERGLDERDEELPLALVCVLLARAVEY